MAKLHGKTGFSCLICEEPVEYGIILHKTRRQTHILCKDCSVGYLGPILKTATENLRKNIRNRIGIFKCPGQTIGQHRNMCKKEINICNLVIASSHPLCTDIFRILYVLSNPNVHVCPNNECGEAVEIDPTNYISRVQCPSCELTWCRTCLSSPFHTDLSCVEYEAAQNNTENGKYIWKMKTEGVLKFCPQCGAPTLKRSGCNKMLCATCNILWCWLCRATGIDYSHYNPDSGNECSNRLWEGVTDPDLPPQ